LINGYTGAIAGQYQKSAWNIFFFGLFVLLVITRFLFLSNQYSEFTNGDPHGSVLNSAANAAFMSDSAPKLDIQYVANLARLELSDEEIANFKPKLQDILGYMKKLDEIDVSTIEPTAHANPVLNVMREDASRPSLSQEQALANAPKATADQIVVAKVVE